MLPAGFSVLTWLLVCSQSRQPFTLFGKHSSSEDLENYSFNFASGSHQVHSTGPGGRPASHMVRNRGEGAASVWAFGC